MKTQNSIMTLLSTLSSLLEAERDCLLEVRFGSLQDINRKKSEALRQLDMCLNQSMQGGINTKELEPHFERVRQQAERNTRLLGSAVNGAKSAVDVLNHIQNGEPVNRTYTALGNRRAMTPTKRKNNLLV